MKQKILIFFLLFMLSFFSAQKNKSYSQKIDSLIELTSPRPFNGVVLITKKGKTKYSKAHGLKNFESKQPLKMDSQFEIMSNTKLFTAVLLLKEVEKGKVDLQSPIKKYLPTFTETWADSVTVHQLLNHTHGITALDKPLLLKLDPNLNMVIYPIFSRAKLSRM